MYKMEETKITIEQKSVKPQLTEWVTKMYTVPKIV